MNKMSDSEMAHFIAENVMKWKIGYDRDMNMGWQTTTDLMLRWNPCNDPAHFDRLIGEMTVHSTITLEIPDCGQDMECTCNIKSQTESGEGCEWGYMRAFCAAVIDWHNREKARRDKIDAIFHKETKP